MIVDWQYEPIKGKLLHIDVKRIAMDKALTVSVSDRAEGESAGVKQEGGILEQILREVEIECLPGDIPSHIEADVSELVFGKVLRVSDLPHNEKLKFLTDEHQPVAARDRGEGRSCGDSGSCRGRSGGGSGRARSHQEGQAGCRGRRRGREEAREEGEEVTACGGRFEPAAVILSEAKDLLRETDRRSRQSWHRVPVHAA